ncbi:ribbon-helix-helix domain-containing protein [Herbaspirillum sp. RTI4]|uniref:ribbon-helix-helix domain-containing protein n=1 Tax=Herbaspirillum sp. RTI4 TaxID=3048640 RepID=UPI002AB5824D|nr:ribbon-helix-helix domain-containing protein [Herbaspirillum sp. RTI4]MDY7580136.1 ribbon-helix-helix domain-containing protein [Herbaspirillum sp. RTI4]MEA9983263.1 ribbon-helix-helix domain-containing protein [Herbaspirillum sp. RTI4]
MSITRPKPKPSVDTFISGAPDAAAEEPHKPKYVRKGKKLQVTLTIAPTLLERVDELAAKLGQSRAAVINMAVYRMVEHGVTIEAL